MFERASETNRFMMNFSYKSRKMWTGSGFTKNEEALDNAFARIYELLEAVVETEAGI